MPSNKPCVRPWPARAARWAMLSSLVLLSTGCATRQVLVRALIDPLPANLATPCEAGPPIPAGNARLGAVLEVWRAREAAAAECRDRHLRTVEAWPR